MVSLETKLVFPKWTEAAAAGEKLLPSARRDTLINMKEFSSIAQGNCRGT